MKKLLAATLLTVVSTQASALGLIAGAGTCNVTAESASKEFTGNYSATSWNGSTYNVYILEYHNFNNFWPNLSEDLSATVDHSGFDNISVTLVSQKVYNPIQNFAKYSSLADANVDFFTTVEASVSRVNGQVPDMTIAAPTTAYAYSAHTSSGSAHMADIPVTGLTTDLSFSINKMRTSTEERKIPMIEFFKGTDRKTNRAEFIIECN